MLWRHGSAALCPPEVSPLCSTRFALFHRRTPGAFRPPGPSPAQISGFVASPRPAYTASNGDRRFSTHGRWLVSCFASGCRMACQTHGSQRRRCKRWHWPYPGRRWKTAPPVFEISPASSCPSGTTARSADSRVIARSLLQLSSQRRGLRLDEQYGENSPASADGAQLHPRLWE